jgi:hypothetical protein
VFDTPRGGRTGSAGDGGDVTEFSLKWLYGVAVSPYLHYSSS